jgi:DNA helicase-2/ATP-dependent DNA helicase PcrA
MVHGLATSESLAVDSWVTEEQAGPAPLAHSAAAVVPWPTSSSDAVRLARSAAAAMVRRAAGPDAAPIRLVDAELVAYQGWRDEAAVLLDELRRDTAAVRRVVLPARLTTSQLVALAADADGLARSLARPMPARPAPQARRGTRFHAWVESLYGERPLLDAEELPGAADAELPDDELAELRTRFLASEYASRQPVAVEVPFELEVGGWLLRGRIDAVYPAPDGFDVIDYKTGKSPRDLAAASLQLSVYRVAWAEIAGVELARVGAAFLYVGSGQLRRPERLLERDELAALLAGAPVL